MLSYIKQLWRGYPTPAERMAIRTSDFQLISLRPFVNNKGILDMNLPLRSPTYITKSDTEPNAAWIKKKISCADDICIHGIDVGIEPKAAGLDLSFQEAIFEAARNPYAEKCRYIVIEHPIIERKHATKNAAVFVNDTVSPDCKDTLSIQLMPY